MTFLRKTIPCLMLLLAPVAAASSGRGASAPPVSETAPAVAQPARVSTTGFPIPGSAVPPPASYTNPVASSFRYIYESVENPLIVPAKEVDGETFARIAEDLTVMSRILEKNSLSSFASADRPPMDPFGLGWRARGKIGPDMLFGSVGRAKPLYVAGYGAAFFIQVDFPLLAPAEKAPEQPTNAQEDRVWSETRRTLFERPAPGAMPEGGKSNVRSYSRERVESLRISLLSVMKHATNIRDLQAQEWLTIVVQGLDSSTSTGRQVMTLRARKADVDAYAESRLDADQFEQRVQAMTY